MRLGTLRDGTRDGALIVVDRTGQRFSRAAAAARTLQGALDDWARAEPALRALAARLEHGTAAAEPLDVRQLPAPLPRAYEWIDGSAYLNHIRSWCAGRAGPSRRRPARPIRSSIRAARASCSGHATPLPLADPAWGLDFESELASCSATSPPERRPPTPPRTFN